MFKKAIIPAIAPVLVLAAASVALPAAAQSHPGHGPWRGPAYERPHAPPAADWRSVGQRKYELERRIDQGVSRRQISRRDAMRLKSELDSLARLEARYLRGGLTRVERSDLERRYDRLEAQIRFARQGGDGRRR